MHAPRLMAKIFLGFCATLIGVIVLNITSPIWYNYFVSYRIRPLTTVKLHHKACNSRPPEASVQNSEATCLFYFEREENPDTVQFQGSGWKIQSTPGSSRIFEVTGTGTITHGPTLISVSEDHVKLNSDLLDYRANRAFIRPSGKVVGFEGTDTPLF